MPLKKNKALVRHFFEDGLYHPEVWNEIFADHISWHAIYHTDHPDFISDSQTENAAYTRHMLLWGGWSVSIDEMIAAGNPVSYFSLTRWSKISRISNPACLTKEEHAEDPWIFKSSLPQFLTVPSCTT